MSAPDLWFGREDIVSTLAEIITGNENPRLAILGAGGMGKTSTALHVIHHEAVVARYRERIFFVACDAATSADLLASHILQVIGVSVDAGENLLTALHLALKCAPPTLLLLDNFESLWEAEKARAATRDLLQKIADSPLSTLIITMRATTPPPGIRWTFFESLPPLPAPSAKEVFLAINATFCDGSNDGNEILDELLMELDYVPLAIHLLAHVSADLSPRFVLKQWQKQRTRMLSLDSYTTDKLESVDVSISLSMESLDVGRNSDAIQLLGMLCLLPGGLSCWQDRLEIIEKTLETATSSLFLLRKFALVYTTGAKLGVLSPIRHFILQHYPPDSQHAQCVSNIIWELVCTHAMVDFGPKFHVAVEALSPEMGNIGNLIDHAVAHNPGEIIVDISIQISWHLWRTHPSSHLLKKVSDLVPLVPTQMRARYFEVYGAILHMQCEYVAATSASTQARHLFLDIGDHLGAAHCTRTLGEILRMQSNYSEATVVLADARAQNLYIGDSLGAAQCSRSLGAILRTQSNHSDAAAILTDARAQFVKIGNRSGAAQCSQSLGDILRMQRKYPEATAILTDARAQFTEIANQLGSAQCSRSLGNILRIQRNYSEANAILTAARAQFIEIGYRLGVAQCSQSLGEILRMQRNYSEANIILTDSRAQFIEIGDRLGDTECSASLGGILIRQKNYTEAENILTHVRAQFIEIGLNDGTAYCSKLLEQCTRERDAEEIMETSS
ncbi:TPR-like protein [Athelia psychrophila]|uniref:TPR-like protein n=1 Tax=Athelia psychrophila TaxID=1759441 RepID=A0A167XN49_9AGAM|nr:TPR-like protein [Fibularhizoctonia sp. CBS 109695]